MNSRDDVMALSNLQQQLQQLIKDGWQVQDPFGMMVRFETTKEEFLEPCYKWWKETGDCNPEKHKDMYAFDAVQALWVNKFGGQSFSEVQELLRHDKWDEIGEKLGIDSNDIFLMEMQYQDSFRHGWSSGWYMIHEALKK